VVIEARASLQGIVVVGEREVADESRSRRDNESEESFDLHDVFPFV
jgi:hypothetical protein